MDFTSQSLYLASPHSAAGQFQASQDGDSWWLPPLGDTLTQATPFNEMIPFGEALTDGTPRFLSNENTYLVDQEQLLWGVPAVPATYPSSSAEVPMMEPWSSASPIALSTPNTSPYLVPGLSYASTSDFPSSGPPTFPRCDLQDDWFEFSMDYPKSAPDRLSDSTRPTDNYPPMRETSTSKSFKLAGQAKARPSSITSSAKRVEAPPANSSRRHQPSTATRRPTGPAPAGVAPHYSRSSFAGNVDPQSMTAPIPTLFPSVNPSQRPNSATVTLSSSASSELASSAISPEHPSPPRFTVKRFVDYSARLQSQGQKRARKDEEEEVKRSKVKVREVTPKKTRNEFQQDPTIVGWSFEDGKGEKDVFRHNFGPSRR